MASLNDVFKFFKDDNYNLAQFRADWQKLSDSDKEQIKNGIENGSLTY